MTKSDEEAVRLLKAGADQGFAMSQYSLAGFYLSGRGGLERSDKEAARLFRLAADQGYPEAQYDLAFLYLAGRGVEQSDGEAVQLFKLAANQGLAVSQYFLGHFYDFGQHGLPQDDREAARLFLLAAGQGFARAQYDLASFYVTGRGGLEKNDREAMRLFTLAADHGYGPQGLVRVFASVGRSPQDDRKLVQQLKHAASQNNGQALYRLAILYETGLAGVPKNIQEAARLYDMAARRGQDAARTELIRLVAESREPKALTPDF